MIALVLASWAGAAEPDPVVDALSAELARAGAELRLPNRPEPYYIAYALSEWEGVNAVAILGGLQGASDRPGRGLRIEVRVGSEALDNSNFVAPGEGTGLEWTNLVLSDQPDAIRHDAWLSTDVAYKDAVENLARKEAERADSAGVVPPPSFVPGVVTVERIEEEPPPLDGDALIELSQRLSAVFLDHPGLHESRVELEASEGRMVFLDTRGAHAERPMGDVTLRAIATARAPDGRSITDHASWYVRHAGDLPPVDDMIREVDALATRLEAWRDIPAASDVYVGPVLFESDAALSLFQELLLPALCGTPPAERPENPWGPEAVHRVGTARLKRRVLPPGWGVADDPTAGVWGRPWDDEGQPGVPVTLVEDGVVRGLLMSRIPNDQATGSTGHGRRNWNDFARAVPTATTVEADATAGRSKLVKRGIKLAQTYDLDHVLVVRRLADPSVVDQEMGFTFSITGGDEGVPAGLSAPIEIVRVYADGREEPVAGLQFSGVDPRVLRDIVGAGPSSSGTWLVQPIDEWGFRGDATSGFIATLEAPSVLISEMELVPAHVEAELPPLLPSPLATE